MSRETNSTSLRKAFERPFKEPRLLGIAYAELGTLLLVTALLYALTIRFLMTRFNLPSEMLMTYFAGDALPPEATSIIFVFVGVASIVLSLFVLFFEAGLFGAIAKKLPFLESAKQHFLAFLLIAIVFEIFEFVTLILYVPSYWLAWWINVAEVLLLFVAVFFFIWRMLAQYTVLTKKPLESVKLSIRELTGSFGYWGRAVMTLILTAIVFALLSLLLLFVGSLHPALLVSVVVILVVFYVYFALAVRIFFFNRIRAK